MVDRRFGVELTTVEWLTALWSSALFLFYSRMYNMVFCIQCRLNSIELNLHLFILSGAVREAIFKQRFDTFLKLFLFLAFRFQQNFPNM